MGMAIVNGDMANREICGYVEPGNYQWEYHIAWEVFEIRFSVVTIRYY